MQELHREDHLGPLQEPGPGRYLLPGEPWLHQGEDGEGAGAVPFRPQLAEAVGATGSFFQGRSVEDHQPAVQSSRAYYLDGIHKFYRPPHHATREFIDFAEQLAAGACFVRDLLRMTRMSHEGFWATAT